MSLLSKVPARVALVLIAALEIGCGTTEPDSPITSLNADGIVIDAPMDTLEPGQTVQLMAFFVRNGVRAPIDNSVRWSSDAPSRLKVDSLTGRAVLPAGDVIYGPIEVPTIFHVTARAGSHQASAAVITGPAIVAKLVISATLAVGRSFLVPIRLLDNGRPFTDTLAVYGARRVTSSDANIIRVNADGTVTSVSSGKAWLRSTLGRHTDSLLVDVISGYPATLLSATDSMVVADVNDSSDVAANRAYPISAGVLISRGTIASIGCNPRQMNNRRQIACSAGRYEAGVLTSAFAPNSTGTVTGIAEDGTLWGTLGTGSAYGVPFYWRDGVMEKATMNIDVESTGAMNSLKHGLFRNTSMYRSSGYWYPGLAFPKPLSPYNGRYDTAYDINDADNAVGSTENFGQTGNAVIWRKADGGAQLLGLLSTAAYGISERDEVVGDGAGGAFLWVNGRYTVLSNALAESGWTLSGNIAISRNGIIAVVASHSSGRRGILIIPLP